MAEYAELFEYNDWANNQLLAVTDELTPEQLAAEMPELGGSAHSLLQHTALVETAFLGLMTGLETRRPREDWTYAEVRELFGQTAAGYRRELPALTARLEEKFQVPWFGRSFTIEQGLLQVTTHSVQHRAGIAAGIARAGREAPNLDYIIWLSQYR
jgi:uncharacterized damage-inducible protein DinB